MKTNEFAKILLELYKKDRKMIEYIEVLIDKLYDGQDK